jgi:hypothetical protein
VNAEKFIRQGICHKIEKPDLIFYGNSKIAILDLPNSQSARFQERLDILPCPYGAGVSSSRYRAAGGRN